MRTWPRPYCDTQLLRTNIWHCLFTREKFTSRIPKRVFFFPRFNFFFLASLVCLPAERFSPIYFCRERFDVRCMRKKRIPHEYVDESFSLFLSRWNQRMTDSLVDPRKQNCNIAEEIGRSVDSLFFIFAEEKREQENNWCEMIDCSTESKLVGQSSLMRI